MPRPPAAAAVPDPQAAVPGVLDTLSNGLGTDADMVGTIVGEIDVLAR